MLKVLVLHDELLPVLQVAHSQVESVHLARVCWTDPAFRRAKELVLGVILALGVRSDRDRCDEMSAIGDEESVLVADVIAFELFQLFEHRREVDDCAIAQHVLRVRVENTTRQQVEGILLSIRNDRVACISSTVESRAVLVLRSEDVDELALAFITPLGSEHDSEVRLKSVQTAVLH